MMKMPGKMQPRAAQTKAEATTGADVHTAFAAHLGTPSIGSHSDTPARLCSLPICGVQQAAGAVSLVRAAAPFGV